MTGTAVVLLNLGGPDSLSAIRPFLFNFFMDKNIIRLPLPLRWITAVLISSRRTKGVAGKTYGLLGGKSPLLANTQEQAQALQKELGKGYRVFVCMRYWHPQSAQVVRAVKEYGPKKIVLLPLYPQYSTTTTRSSFQDWDREAAKAGLTVETERLCCYPLDKGFIKASTDHIKTAYAGILSETAGKKTALPRVLFSAHGLPESVIKDGDPYQWQCEQTAQEIARATGIPSLDWILCYQSRVGPKKWIEPSMEDALIQAAADGVPVLIYPHSFVSEHAETLVDIEINYRELAKKLGIPRFERVPTVGTSPAFIRGLADRVRAGGKTERSCPSTCRRCPL